MERLTLNISGMSCGHCVARVTNALKSVAGVEAEDVKVGSAAITYDPQRTSAAQIAAAVEGAGYNARAAEQTVS